MNSTLIHFPSGGGEFHLPRLTIGVFRNHQPTHRVAIGGDKTKVPPMQINQGWVLPADASGICEYDSPLDVLMVEMTPQVLTEVGMMDKQDFAPIFGSLDPLILQLILNAECLNQGGALYQETMHWALATQLRHTLQPDLTHTPPLQDLRLRQVIDYIHDHLADDLTLSVMANIAAMSHYHFSRAFKTATGKSPLQYVITERLELAKVLLRTTNMSIAQICLRIGYNDLSRFSQHFKRMTGATPGQFRKH